MTKYEKECEILDDLEKYLSEKHSVVLSVKQIRKTLKLYEEIERDYEKTCEL